MITGLAKSMQELAQDRRALGVSQAAFSKLTGLSRAIITHLETGRMRPREYHLIQYAEALAEIRRQEKAIPPVPSVAGCGVSVQAEAPALSFADSKAATPPCELPRAEIIAPQAKESALISRSEAGEIKPVDMSARTPESNPPAKDLAFHGAKDAVTPTSPPASKAHLLAEREGQKRAPYLGQRRAGYVPGDLDGNYKPCPIANRESAYPIPPKSNTGRPRSLGKASA